jgi:hypothetical protein
MKKVILFLSCFLVGFNFSYGADAEAKVERQIVLKSSVKKVSDWIDANKDDLREASGINVLEDLGNGKYKVRRNSPKGVFVWVTKETKEIKNGTFVFRSDLIESIQGGITEFSSEIIVKNQQNMALIHITSSAGVDNPKLKTTGLRIDMNTSINKVEMLIKQNCK